jgi:O-antigen/teichoic acid export membrane protein
VAGGVLSFLLATAYQIVIARRIGAAGFGVLALALAIASLLAEGSDLGLDYGVLRFGGIARKADQPGTLRAIVQHAVRGSLLLGSVAGFALAAASGLIADVFDKSQLAPALVPLALTVPFTATTEVARASLRAMGRAGRPVASSSLIGPGLRLITGVGAVVLVPSATAAAWGYFVTEALLFAITGFMLWQLLPPADGSDFPPRKLLRFSMPMSLNRLLLYSNNQTEILFLGFLASSATLGIFGVARRLSLLVGSALLTSFAILFDPLVAGLHHEGRTEDLGRIFKTSTRWLFTLGLPISLAEMLFATEIMKVFGEEFAAGGTALAILAVGQLINVATGITSNLQAMAGYAKVTLLNAALFISVSIVFDILLIPNFGLIGAAAANSTAVVTINVVRLIQIRKRLGLIPYDRRFWRPLAAAVPASVIAVLVPLPEMRNAAELLIHVAILGLVYFGVLVTLGIEPVDREVMRAAVMRFRGRRAISDR